jgi:hypothetical protein
MQRREIKYRRFKPLECNVSTGELTGVSEGRSTRNWKRVEEQHSHRGVQCEILVCYTAVTFFGLLDHEHEGTTLIRNIGNYSGFVCAFAKLLKATISSIVCLDDQRHAVLSSLYLFYCQVTLHVSGVFRTQHQEYTNCNYNHWYKSCCKLQRYPVEENCSLEDWFKLLTSNFCAYISELFF